MAKIIVATTESERQAIYRFRYQVYVEEMQKQPRSADHLARTLTDALDETATLLYMTQGDQIIAALRRSRLDHCRLPDGLEQTLALAQFADAFPRSRLSLSSRFVVAAEWRNSLAPGSLILATYRMAREQGIQFDFLHAAPWLLPFYKSLGYRCYAPHFLESDVGLQIPQVLLLEDLDYLQAVRSPLLRVARQFPNRSEARDWFAKLPAVHPLPIPPTIPGWQTLDADTVQQLMQAATVYSLPPGQAVVRLGDVTNAMFIVLTGEVEVSYVNSQTDPAASAVAILKPGQTFGETNLFNPSPSLEQAVTLTPTDLLILPKSALAKLMKTIPATMCQILLNASRSLCDRYIPSYNALSNRNVA
ncbi:MAG: cyclic nucleotide-binding domain-containing protein [Elainella sp.]